MIDEVPGLPSNASCDGEAKATVFQPATIKVDTLTPLGGEDSCNNRLVWSSSKQPRLIRGSIDAPVGKSSLTSMSSGRESVAWSWYAGDGQREG